MSQTRLLFVDRHNRRGSVLAEGMLRHLLAEDDRLDEFLLDSCATCPAAAGQRPDELACRTARARGFEIADRRARALRAGDPAQFDLLLALDAPTLATLRGLTGSHASRRSHLLLDFAPWLGLEALPDEAVADPDELADLLDTLELAVRGLIEVVDQSKAEWRVSPAIPRKGKASSAT